MTTLLLTIAPLISAVAITVSYIPQLRLTFKTKNVTGQSVTFWVLLNIALLGLFLQQLGLILYAGNTNLMGLMTQGLNLLCASVMLVMVANYRKDDK